MGTQDAGAEDILSDTVHTGTQRGRRQDTVSEPTYYTRRELYAPNSPEEGGAEYPPREPPNAITPPGGGGIGEKVIAIQIKQGQKAP